MILFKPKQMITLLLACGVIGWMWHNNAFDPFRKKSQDAQVRQKMAQQWAQYATRLITNPNGELAERPVIALAGVVDDHEGLLDAELHQWLKRRNVKVAKKGWVQSFWQTIGWRHNPTSIEAAIIDCQASQADYIVAVRINNWTTYPAHEQQLAGMLHVYTADHHELIGTVPITIDPTTAPIVGIEGEQPDLAYGIRFAKKSLVSIEVDRGELHSDQNFHSEIVSGLDRQIETGLPASSGNMTKPGNSARHNSSREDRFWFQSGFGVWVFLVITGPWMLRRPIADVLLSYSNQGNAHLMVCWCLACLFTAILLWAFWLPLVPAAICLAGSLAFACIYLGFCCQWIEVL